MLWVGLGTSIGLVGVLAAESPPLALLVPGTLLGLLALRWLFTRPLLNLVVLVTLFAITAGYKEGVQVDEVAFAIYFLLYAAHWLFIRVVIQGEPLLRDASDWFVALFLVYVIGSLALTVLHRGDLLMALNEGFNFSLLALYFPFRDVCEREERGLTVLFSLVIILGLVASLRNFLHFQAILSDATYAWQIARGRVMVNEMFLLVAALITLTTALYARRITWILIYSGLFGTTSVALILTQSRAYWVDLALGVFLLFLLIDLQRKKRFVVLGALGAFSFVGVLYLLVGDFLFLLAYGLADRLLSLQSATSSDISLINRFFEMEALWALIKVNPIIGYGMGVKFTFFDAISHANWVKTFAHNGYMMLWFKFGLVGLSLILGLWGRSLWVAFRTAREHTASLDVRMFALALGICLIALIPSHNSSATFSTGDTVLMFGLLTGWISGLSRRATIAPLRGEAGA